MQSLFGSEQSATSVAGLLLSTAETGDQIVTETSTTPAQQIALWADKLRDMSAMGLHYTKDIYDKQRYRDIQTMAMEMHALATGDKLETLEPLRDVIYSRPMPIVGASAFVFEGERLLLIRRADDQKWALPGGALEVGEAAAQGAEREALEESGVHCKAVKLVGVFDGRFIGRPSRHHIYHLVFACQPTGEPDTLPPSHAVETMGKAWFDMNALPANLSGGHERFIEESLNVLHGSPPFFDQ